MQDQNQFVTIIKPVKGLRNIDLKELWHYRELLWIFTWRDLKVRYKQTALGALWAIIPPILTMLVFSTFFGNFANIPSEDIPYPIFVFTGLLIWNYFSSSLTNASNSTIVYLQMIQKIYFPRLLLPASSIIAGLVDLLIASTILLILMIYYGIYPAIIGLLILPILILITILSALGIGFFMSAINVKYRDVRYIIPFFVQLGLFITPVIYPLSITKGKWEYILWLNPMTGVIENARAGLLGTGAIEWTMLLFSVVLSIGLFLFGILYFKHMENEFADII